MRRAFIVGAGGSGFLHALALRSAGVPIAYVFDPSRERAEWLAGLTGARAVDSLDVDSEVVAICSPPAFHLEQASRVSREGRLTFLEKPLGMTSRELRELSRLPNIVPILQWRAGQSAFALRRAFSEQTFGRDIRISAEFRLWRDADYWRSKNWGCGAMLSIGIHAVDLLVWSVGRPVVRSTLRDSPLRGTLNLEFDDGTVADIRIALDWPDRNEFQLRVVGSLASTRLLATEADPTASPLLWRGPDLEDRPVEGATGSPLLVPYLHAALAGEGISVRDVTAAHALVMLSGTERPAAFLRA